MIHYKQGRFKNRRFLCQTAKALSIPSFSLPLEVLLGNLKDAKRECLTLKKSHQLARDTYASESEDRAKELKKIRSKEKMKLKWKMYKKYFGKRRMNSISQVEYFSGATLVRVSSQFAVESAIMAENSTRFKLAYSSPLLQPPLLQRLGLCSEILRGLSTYAFIYCCRVWRLTSDVVSLLQNKLSGDLTDNVSQCVFCTLEAGS